MHINKAVGHDLTPRDNGRTKTDRIVLKEVKYLVLFKSCCKLSLFYLIYSALLLMTINKKT